MPAEDLEDIELDLLIEALKRVRGQDFSNYARASFKRRVARQMQRMGHARVAALIEPLIYDESAAAEFVTGIFVSVTEFIRDPEFFAALREHVFPYLASYPRPKIWHAGCATGEEAYSVAILLKEANLLHRAVIYATDLNLPALRRAKAGVYRACDLEEADPRFRLAGGRSSLLDHVIKAPQRTGEQAQGDRLVMMNRELREAITWSLHDLRDESLFSESHLSVCRNTLIYFDRELQARVVQRLLSGLAPGGFLALGSKESLDVVGYTHGFTDVSRDQRIFQRLNLLRRLGRTA